MIRRFILLAFVFNSLACYTQNQYIYDVLEYTPAPGQLMNKGPWGLPESAESILGTINGSLTLGAWGGYVVFRFENPVQNHPDNPFGIDFILFGNPVASWSEPATVWVMKDNNANGIPDGTWHQLAGSDYFFSSTRHNYQLTYFNPKSETAVNVPWKDHLDNEGFVFANSFHTQAYYPDHEIFNHIAADQYTLSGTRIMGAIDKTNPATIISTPRAFGYADNIPRRATPYNVPNNPYTMEIENAGGDGFDISWAVDHQGNYVELDEIHFIKVQTAMLDDGGWMGDVSTEITGGVVVEPNSDITGVLDRVVVKDLPPVIHESPFPLEAFAFHKGRLQPDKTILWTTNLEGTFVDEKGWLHFDGSGELHLTAYLEDNPQILTVANTSLDFSSTHAGYYESQGFKIFPNPTADFINIEAEQGTHIILCNLKGIKLMDMVHPGGIETLDCKHLKAGVYLLSLIHAEGTFQEKIIIRK